MQNETDQEVIESNDSENVEEVVDTEVEETAEVETDNTPTLDDYKELERKNKMLYERVKKAEGLNKKSASRTLTNLKDTGLTKEEIILYSKGYTDDEVVLAKKLAEVNGTNVLVVAEDDDYFKTKVSERKSKDKSKQASLGAASGGAKYVPEKSVGEMTDEEHQKYFQEVMSNV